MNIVSGSKTIRVAALLLMFLAAAPMVADTITLTFSDAMTVMFDDNITGGYSSGHGYQSINYGPPTIDNLALPEPLAGYVPNPTYQATDLILHDYPFNTNFLIFYIDGVCSDGTQIDTTISFQYFDNPDLNLLPQLVAWQGSDASLEIQAWGNQYSTYSGEATLVNVEDTPTTGTPEPSAISLVLLGFAVCLVAGRFKENKNEHF